ncbi:hypothetical protein [Engelhardtia mirabilis]|uniref:Uncharacterized protein n=1 Tax=Engelhardtia mirabilis TaxID=2528011 RepID=A0A518BLY1_9BACT|nr:hypothetical protein Pla133_30760 [Planctomycetes bacterium Pla133]QDV02311.1 hypothetical protein Pla86_30750 [Planctomycetes bacterium Pla86]
MKAILATLCVTAALIFSFSSASLSFAEGDVGGDVEAAADNDCLNSTKTYAECIACCQDNYEENIKDCTDVCTVCDTWLWFICIGWEFLKDCHQDCMAGAKQVRDACVAGCAQP